MTIAFQLAYFIHFVIQEVAKNEFCGHVLKLFIKGSLINFSVQVSQCNMFKKYLITQYCQYRYPNWRLLIYTGDTDACPEKIIRNAKLRFNIVVPTSIEFIYLHKRSWLDPLKYSYFSLLGSSVGSIFVGIEALLKFTPG